MNRHAEPLAFADRLASRAREIGSWMVVGLDPDAARFPEAHLTDSLCRTGGLGELIFEFNQAVIAGAGAQAAAFKPQIAFYEQYGLEGIAALGRTLKELRGLGIPVILDGKRNDIGSTAAAYARAWLKPVRELAPGCERDNDWRVDALTVSPYLGRDGIAPFVSAAESNGGGLFVLLRTSNPSGADLQCVQLEGTRQPLWRRLAEQLRGDAGRLEGAESGLSGLGFVVGATLASEEVAAIRGALPNSLFLMPGIGAQGGDIGVLRAARAGSRVGILPSASRSLLYPEGGRGDWRHRRGDRASWLREVRSFSASESSRLARSLHPLLFE